MPLVKRRHVDFNPEWDQWRCDRRHTLDKRGNARHQENLARTALDCAQGTYDEALGVFDGNPEKIAAAKLELEIREELAREAQRDYLCIEAMEPEDVPLKRTKRGSYYPCKCGMTKIRGPKWKNKNCRYWITHPECKPNVCMRPQEQWISRGQRVILWMTRYPVV